MKRELALEPRAPIFSFETGPGVGAAMARVASVGECMIELSQPSGALLARSYGGDRLNTAVYLR